MMDNVINLGADEKLQAEREAQIEEYVTSLFGPQQTGHSLIVEGRCIPNITVRKGRDEQGNEEIEFILDGRLAFGFPREWAGHAAVFAANAMAIGAGYPSLNGDNKERPFAPQVSFLGADMLGPVA